MQIEEDCVQSEEDNMFLLIGLYSNFLFAEPAY